MNSISNIKVTLIGSGKVATSLAHTLVSHGVIIQEVYSRQLSHAKKLAQAVAAKQATQSLDFTKSSSQVFIISVKDDAIQQVAEEIKLPEKAILLHTSGTVSINTLATTARPHGILYPLMTFGADQLIDFDQVPILTESNSIEAQDILDTLARSISTQVQAASESERQLLHVAAVFASNFTNRMIAASEEILTGTQLPTSMLKPLLTQTIQNAWDTHPDEALTGPAKRGDVETIKKHLNLLKEKPKLAKIYEVITESITSKF
ncbi:DUF2520 domain-containing protein [Reichenbachiella carrageenanivorans]|uniref:DUF2520 domain-containing protein n=1 Tax=Reichenbachiella carrageenanivorans TaxID=2979869 RepID=A0ABY6D1P8_9BACT|nr:Rossmann-like and DUF2520 domain-containing protein [Reichenbachiella carrageenanivorans]UXX80048.1 DUF2520 domain-containing protein [Reichenbachiella carrageenanivorans]